MKVSLEDVSTRGSSNIAQKDLEGSIGSYPIFGASGYIKSIDFYHQAKEYIAVVKDGAGVGRTMFMPANSSVIGTLQYILPKDNIVPKYLYYAVKNMKLERYYTGAAIPHIYYKDYKKEVFELPEMEEQKRVVEILEKVEDIIRDFEQLLCDLDILIKSRFVEMFVSEESNCWNTVTIADVCNDMRTGPFGSALHHDEFVDSGIFVLGIDNAVENKFSYNRMRYITEEKYQKLKRYTVYPRDVIITIMGTIGRSAVIPDDMPVAINTKHLACLTINEMANPYFICSAFQIHPEIRRQLQGNKKGAIMDGLNLTIIKGLKFKLPPIELQNNFVDFLTQIDKLKVVKLKYKERMRKL